jgi:type IV pilus assembly protein PilQ
VRTSTRTAPLALIAALFLNSVPGAAQSAAGARISTVEIGALAGAGLAEGAEVVIRGDAKLEFTVFRLQNPTRIVLDLPGADIGSVRAPAELPEASLVKEITTTQFQGKSGEVARVVVVLRADVTFDARHQGQDVVLVARRGMAGESPAPLASAAEPTVVVELEGSAEPIAAAKSLLGVSARGANGGTVVNLSTDGAVGRYEIEQIDSPPRLVIDLYGLAGPKGMTRQLDAPAVARARAARHADKIRVVLDGRGDRLPSYDVAATDSGLTILFQAADAAPRPAVGSTLTEVSLERKDGFYRIRLDVTGKASVHTVKDSPLKKAIALGGVDAGAMLGRKDFNQGPVDALDITRADRADDTVRVELLLTRAVEHSVWQKDGAVFWDIREKSASGAVATSDRPQPRAAPHAVSLSSVAQEGAASRRYQGKKITIDLMDADIINVLRLLGDVSGKNVVIGDDVKGNITIKLKNVPWDQALDVILKTKGLDMEQRGGIIRVAPKVQLDAERTARLNLEVIRRQQVPTTVRLIPVNYAVAAELVPQIRELLSERGRVTFDQRTNVIIVEDIRDNLEQAERLVRTLDTQTPQVLIEARMVEASTTFIRNLGIQWGGGLFFSERGGNPTGLIFPNNVGVVGAADSSEALQPGIAATPGVLFPNNFAVNVPSDDVASGVGMNLGSIGNFGFLNARLTAAETTGQAKTISAPKVTTLNNRTARIFQGQQILVQVVTNNIINTNTVEAQLDLEVTPHVTADGSVLMTVLMTNNRPNFNQRVGDTPSIDTKGAETELLVKDGDTAVIGGIYTRNFGENYRQTPFLSQIPLLGWLFKAYNATDSRSEMLVFLTPRIINRRSATPGGQ